MDGRDPLGLRAAGGVRGQVAAADRAKGLGLGLAGPGAGAARAGRDIQVAAERVEDPEARAAMGRT